MSTARSDAAAPASGQAVSGASQGRRTQSLQARLTWRMLSLVSVVWVVAAVATWYDTEHEVGELLDAHLSQAASLLVSQSLDDLNRFALHETPTLHRHQPKAVFQVWHAGALVVRSATAPVHPLMAPTERGFAKVVVDGVGWRVFSVQGKEPDVVVHVAELDRARRDVVLASMRSVIWPMTLALPFLVFGVWGAVRHALKPLSELGHQVAHRQPDASDPLPDTGVPREVQPLVEALNRLFERIAVLIESERRFTADAAHELRTPIAGIRMQAQVAQGALDATERDDALAATLVGCDRAARLVDQLLQLARLESQSDVTGHRAHVPTCMRGVVADLAQQAAKLGQQVHVHCDEPATPEEASCPVPEGLLAILMRNLLDNALRYSPPGAVVRVAYRVAPDGRGTLTVEDSGPGMTPEQIRRLGERFFRVMGTDQPGSGLGWSIVTRMARLYNLSLSPARSPELGGLRVTVSWALA